MATITASPHTVDGGDRRMAGAGAMLAGVAAFVALEATAKWLGADYPTSQVVFVRATLGALFALALVPALGGWRSLALTRPLAHVLRGGLLVLAQYTYFAGLRDLGLPEATALSFSVPFFVAALSVPLLRERVGVSRWIAVLVGFAGVGVVLRPTPASFEPAGLLILVAALAYALALLVTRRVAAAQPVGAQVVYGQAVAAGFSSLMLIPGGWSSPTAPGDLGLFALLGLLGTANFALITAAFRLAPAPTCAPLYYTAIVWSTLLGWLLWGDTLDALTWAGTGIVIACGLKVVGDEHRSRAPVPSSDGPAAGHRPRRRPRSTTPRPAARALRRHRLSSTGATAVEAA